MSKRDSEGILLSQNGENQPVKSGSVPCDSRGGYSKQSQLAHFAEKHPGYKHGEKTYDPRLPSRAGDYAAAGGTRSSVSGTSTSEPSGQNQKGQPSHGGSVPSHKDVTEGQGGKYHKNVSQTRIAGDGKATVRTMNSKPEVRRNQANANNDVSSRKKSEWGN